MIQNTIIKKGLIVGIVLLFLTIGFSPIITAQDNTKSIGSVPITILEYKADGTVEKTVVRMSPEQADNFHEEMRNAQDLDSRLSIYKKYNLISQDVTADTLQAGMQEKARSMGLTQDDLMSQFRSSQSLFPPFVRRNIFCYVSGGEPTWDGFCFPPITSGVRHFGLLIFITDCSIETLGLLGTFSLECFFVKLVGFVGIIEWGYHNTWRGLNYDGFCVYTKALGTPD
jgi:hypothetical protein